MTATLEIPGANALLMRVTVSSSSYCYPRLMRVTVKRSGGWATLSFCSWNNSTAFKCSAGKQPKVIGFNTSKVDSNHRLKVSVKYLSPFSSDHLTTKKKVFSFFFKLDFYCWHYQKCPHASPRICPPPPSSCPPKSFKSVLNCTFVQLRKLENKRNLLGS